MKGYLMDTAMDLLEDFKNSRIWIPTWSVNPKNPGIPDWNVNSDAWVTYEEAKKKSKTFGYVIPPGYIVLDFDFSSPKKPDPTLQTALSPRAVELLLLHNSYTTRTYTEGPGLHTIFHCDYPFEKSMYSSKNPENLMTGQLLTAGHFVLHIEEPPMHKDLVSLFTAPIQNIDYDHLTAFSPTFTDNTRGRTYSIATGKPIEPEVKIEEPDSVEFITTLFERVPSAPSKLLDDAYAALDFSASYDTYSHFLNGEFIIAEQIVRIEHKAARQTNTKDAERDIDALFKVFRNWGRKDPNYADVDDETYNTRLKNSIRSTKEDLDNGKQVIKIGLFKNLLKHLQPQWPVYERTKDNRYVPDYTSTKNVQAAADLYQLKHYYHAYEPNTALIQTQEGTADFIFPASKENVIHTPNNMILLTGELEYLATQLVESAGVPSKQRKGAVQAFMLYMADDILRNKRVYDPIAAVINHTKWDGKDHQTEVFKSIIHEQYSDSQSGHDARVRHINEGLERWLAHFVGIRQDNITTRYTDLPLIPIMCGGQSGTKSSFFTALTAGSGFEQYEGALPAKEVMSSNNSNSDLAVIGQKLMGLPFLMINEIENLFKIGESAFKEWASIKESKFRAAYARGLMSTPRNNLILGNTNHITIPNLDHGGHRRLLVMLVKAIEQVRLRDLDLHQLFAQIAHKNYHTVQRLKEQGSWVETSWMASREWIHINDKYMADHKGGARGDDLLITYLAETRDLSVPFDPVVYRKTAVSERKVRCMAQTVTQLERDIREHLNMHNIPNGFQHMVRRWCSEYTGTTPVDVSIPIGKAGEDKRRGGVTNVIKQGSYKSGGQELFVLPPLKGA